MHPLVKRSALLATVAAVAFETTIYGLHNAEHVEGQLSLRRLVLSFEPQSHIEVLSPNPTSYWGSTLTASGSATSVAASGAY